MATIKNYTDLEQSKKLAEILPLESADMTYCAITEGMRDNMIIKDWEVIIGLDTAIKDNLFSYRNGYMVPCWSLAALLSVLPKNLNIGRPSLESNYKGYYWIQYYDEFMEANDYKTECFNNPIDACYEMIVKLHELNLL